MIRNVTEALFNDILKRTDRLIVVEFWSPRCSICRDVASAYEDVSNEMATEALFLRVNADANSKMAARYGVQGTPTFVMFCREGKVADVVGLTSATMLRNTIKDAIRYKVPSKGRKKAGSDIDGYG